MLIGFGQAACNPLPERLPEGEKRWEGAILLRIRFAKLSLASYHCNTNLSFIARICWLVLTKYCCDVVGGVERPQPHHNNKMIWLANSRWEINSPSPLAPLPEERGKGGITSFGVGAAQFHCAAPTPSPGRCGMTRRLAAAATTSQQ